MGCFLCGAVVVIVVVELADYSVIASLLTKFIFSPPRPPPRFFLGFDAIAQFSISSRSVLVTLLFRKKKFSILNFDR